MGRKKIPTKDKKLKGTFRKDRAFEDEIEFDKAPKCPAPPSILGKDGQDEWNRVAPQVWSRGTLNETDHSNLLAYCQKVEEYLHCVKHVQKNGYVEVGHNKKGDAYYLVNPHVLIGNKALAFIIKISTEFGFTPSSRTRISVGKARDVDPKEEKLRKLMRLTK